ncbi:MAG: 2Fe-2S iron-sulfur cluster binding domain-containing protein [Calditerrivibrio sp.]|nr:2Fe-2S iron-sulfur cluster binding domain-containing protein [Calditerrivibrio sp.]
MFFGGKKYKVIIKNLNITIEVRGGTNLYEILVQNGIAVPSLCKGSGQCGKCKVRIVSADGKPINKPSKKDNIILAPISIDAGFRLACQYEVKSDILVDTTEFYRSPDVDTEIVSIKKKPSVKSEEKADSLDKKEIESAKNTDPTKAQDTLLEDIIKPQVIKVTPRKKEVNQENKPQENVSVLKQNEDLSPNEETYDPVDGVILVQYPQGVKYFTYSPSIDNISGEGFVKTSEKLISFINDIKFADFLYNKIGVKNAERLLIITDDRMGAGDILLNLITYHKIDLNGLFCEIVSPYEHPKDLLSFFRLVSNIKDNALSIPLDNLSDCYFSSSGKLYHLNCRYIVEDIKIMEFINVGKNPIIDISADLTELIIKDNLSNPDSILLTALLRTIASLKVLGIVDQNLNLKSRNELIDRIPLELLVKLSFRNEQRLFNIFRNKDVNIYISQNELDTINHLRVFINTLCTFTEKNCGKIDTLSFHTLSPMETLINEFINMSIIPQKFSKKTRHLHGDPVVNCIKFFNYKDIPSFIKKTFGEEFITLDLYKNEDFNNISKIFEKEFLSH